MMSKTQSQKRLKSKRPRSGKKPLAENSFLRFQTDGKKFSFQTDFSIPLITSFKFNFMPIQSPDISSKSENVLSFEIKSTDQFFFSRSPVSVGRNMRFSFQVCEQVPYLFLILSPNYQRFLQVLSREPQVQKENVQDLVFLCLSCPQPQENSKIIQRSLTLVSLDRA